MYSDAKLDLITQLREGRLDRKYSYGARDRAVPMAEQAYFLQFYGVDTSAMISGAALFERVLEDPGYDIFRQEVRLIEKGMLDLMRNVKFVLELGPGDGKKTAVMLRVLRQLTAFSAIEYARESAALTRGMLADEFPKLASSVACADFFEAQWPRPPLGTPSALVILGGTIANFTDAQISQFFGKVGAYLNPGDPLVMGIDCNQDGADLRRAYENNITAVYFLNALAEVNRILGTRMTPNQFAYRVDLRRTSDACYVDMILTPKCDVALPEGERLLAEGQDVLVGVSQKMMPDKLAGFLSDAGLIIEQSLSNSGSNLIRACNPFA